VKPGGFSFTAIKYEKIIYMTNPIDDTEKLYEELQGISDQIETELALERIAEQSLVELKRLEMQPLFDEYYTSRRFNQVLEKGAKKPVLRDPKGGLTAAGRAYFKRKEGANLKPGVMGAANTPQKMRRKGSFLTRFFTNPSGPMKDEKGRSTRLALSAAAWGEPVPQDMEDARRLAAKGRRLLERYENSKKKKKSDFEFDVFNKTANENYYTRQSEPDMAGLWGVIDNDTETINNEDERIIRLGIREDFVHMGASEKAMTSYVPEDSESRRRMAHAARVMSKRRKKKSNG
jgi:hypothetical protein